VVGCYFTRDPRSTSLSAKPHGRVGLAIKALELMLSVAFALNVVFSVKWRMVSATVTVTVTSVVCNLPVSFCIIMIASRCHLFMFRHALAMMVIMRPHM
jgi:hypothetical protein